MLLGPRPTSVNGEEAAPQAPSPEGGVWSWGRPALQGPSRRADFLEGCEDGGVVRGFRENLGHLFPSLPFPPASRPARAGHPEVRVFGASSSRGAACVPGLGHGHAPLRSIRSHSNRREVLAHRLLLPSRCCRVARTEAPLLLRGGHLGTRGSQVRGLVGFLSLVKKSHTYKPESIRS